MLVIDADGLLASLVWRGRFPVGSPDSLAQTRVLAGIELPGKPLVWPSAPAAGELPSSTETREVDLRAILGGATPFAPDRPSALPLPSAEPKPEPMSTGTGMVDVRALLKGPVPFATPAATADLNVPGGRGEDSRRSSGHRAAPGGDGGPGASVQRRRRVPAARGEHAHAGRAEAHPDVDGDDGHQPRRGDEGRAAPPRDLGAGPARGARSGRRGARRAPSGHRGAPRRAGPAAGPRPARRGAPRRAGPPRVRRGAPRRAAAPPAPLRGRPPQSRKPRPPRLHPSPRARTPPRSRRPPPGTGPLRASQRTSTARTSRGRTSPGSTSPAARSSVVFCAVRASAAPTWREPT